MPRAATNWPRAVRVLVAPLLVLSLAACGTGSGGSATPFIGATVVGFTPRATGAGLAAGAVVLVGDPTTGQPFPGAAVTVNGSPLAYDAGAGEYLGTAPIAAGAEVVVAVALEGRTYRASGRLAAYPVLTAPGANDTWSALGPHAVTWQAGAPLAGTTYAIGMLDAADPNGPLVWPMSQELQSVPTTATTFRLEPGSLTGGARVMVAGLVALGSFPGAAAGSGLVLSGFDAVPVTVTVGTPLASGPGPVNLLASGGRLLWTDGEAAVRSVPAGGGPVTSLVERHAMPEAVRVVGTSLYWIAGQQLLRSALDGTGTTVVAEGPRDTGPAATSTEFAVDGTAAYWVNTAPGGSCTSACRWAIVRVPLDGGAPSALATTDARVVGLAVDASTVYWVQQGSGPVSADGRGPEDSAVRAVPKAGGAAATLVDGFLNGPPPVLLPGYVPGNWFSGVGLLVAGERVIFTTAAFDGYRVLAVPTAGGDVTELQSVLGGNSSFVQAMATDGATLFWIDGTSVKALALSGGAAADLATGLYKTTGLAVAGGRVTWSETACCSVVANGSVRSVASDGSDPVLLADLRDNPAGVAADAGAAWWIEGGPLGAIEGYGRLVHAAQAGGGAETVVAAVLTDRPALAADDERVILADGWRARAAPLAGGPLEDIFRGGWTLVGVASDGVNVWALDAFGTLARAPVAGGPGEVVFPSGPGASGATGPLRLGGGHAYWVDTAGVLRRVALSGGVPEAVATGLPALSDLAVDGTFAYLAPVNGPLQLVPVTGGTPAVIGAGTFLTGGRLALDGERLYWIDATRLGRITLSTQADQVLAIGLDGDPALGNAIAVDAVGIYWIESGSGTIKRSDDR